MPKETPLRAEKAENELLGDPELDQEMPVYLDAVFEAARAFICPEL